MRHGSQLCVSKCNAATSRSPSSVDSESGRGLLLVADLADRWGTEPYPPSGETVWAEVSARTY